VQAEWDTIPISVSRTWNPNLGRPEWEPYACYDFVLLLGEDQFAVFDGPKLSEELREFGAIWKDCSKDPHIDLSTFEHKISGKVWMRDPAMLGRFAAAFP
jgi:hypothetical protein